MRQTGGGSKARIARAASLKENTRVRIGGPILEILLRRKTIHANTRSGEFCSWRFRVSSLIVPFPSGKNARNQNQDTTRVRSVGAISFLTFLVSTHAANKTI